MKKIFAICGAALMTLACAKEMPQGTDAPAVSDGLKFMATVEPASKVLTSAGKSTWELEDKISIFSVKENGVIVGCNVLYKASSAGATTEFEQGDKSVGKSDKYYAFYPASLAYPSDFKANESVGFGGNTAGTGVNDYKFMPIAINAGNANSGGVKCTYNAETGQMSTNQTPYFYASADAPSEEGEAVNLVFRPILPVIEFGLKGSGTVKNMVVEYADKATDVLDADANKWLTAKGVFNISTGVLTTTNTASPAYGRIYVDLKTTTEDYIQLNNETPVYFQLVVGRFEITMGLKITFTDKDGNTFEKTIWTDKTYKGMSDSGNPKFISQVINVPGVEYDADSYYEVDVTTLDWTKSYIHNVTVGGNTMAVITKEFFGAGVNKQGVVVYPASSNVADYTQGKVLEVTLDGDAAPTGDVHGGTLNAWTTTATDVAYTAGESAPITKIYVKGNGSEILFTAPEGEVLKTTPVPYTLTSTSGQVHPLVKIGERFWTACGYKTTKQIDDTDINQINPSDALTAESASMVISDDMWLYNGIAIGFTNESVPSFTNKIAPSGWSLPSIKDWNTDLAAFLGVPSYPNMTKSLLFSRTTYNIKDNQLNSLGYYSTWACDSFNEYRAQMVLSNASGEQRESPQHVSAMFEIRLVSVKPSAE